MNTVTNTGSDLSMGDVQKPSPIKAIQVLIVVRALLALAFYVVFTVKDITIGSVGPQIILYTFLAFVVLAIPTFYFLNKRNAWGTRIAMLVDLGAAVPAGAFISIAISLVMVGLTFTKKARGYFGE